MLQTIDGKVFYTLKEASRAVGVSVSTLYRRFNDGSLRYVQLGDRRLIPAKVLLDLINGKSR